MPRPLMMSEPLESLLMLHTAYLQRAMQTYILCVPLQLSAYGYAALKQQADFETRRWGLNALRTLLVNARMKCKKAMHRD